VPAVRFAFRYPSFFGRRCFKCGAGLSGQKIALAAIADQSNNFIARADPRPSAVLSTLSDRLYADVREMIDFLTNMPASTVIFITLAVLGLAVTLIVLRRLI
jgi:hypothetical protein